MLVHQRQHVGGNIRRAGVCDDELIRLEVRLLDVLQGQLIAGRQPQDDMAPTWMNEFSTAWPDA
jgi:hypothetical protein